MIYKYTLTLPLSYWQGCKKGGGVQWPGHHPDIFISRPVLTVEIIIYIDYWIIWNVFILWNNSLITILLQTIIKCGGFLAGDSIFYFRVYVKVLRWWDIM